MAGEWIKIEHTLPLKPEIDKMADALSLDPDSVVGKLVRFWIWADQHSLDGNGLDVTDKGIDRRAGLDGFADALRKVGWLKGRDAALSLPNFSRHNGQTAKSRAASNRRVAAHRHRQSNADVTPEPLQKALPEKRREEALIPPDPRAAEACFERFWALYPNKVKRAFALAAYQRKGCVSVADSLIDGLRLWIASEQWREARFIPHAENWLEAEQWEDKPTKRGATHKNGVNVNDANHNPC